MIPTDCQPNAKVSCRAERLASGLFIEAAVSGPLDSLQVRDQRDFREPSQTPEPRVHRNGLQHRRTPEQEEAKEIHGLVSLGNKLNWLDT